ncbi:hypothetical protein JN11_03937 [Mucilaginibacter frigoritolerans]|uniref:Uncharacterized protein n=1 Tax=Mucilaginibacter frigoritolerans TaxID=652788 RepID=A0A562TUE4_9SPHI|nr:hypothetical protein [Mucilaginibacter frigoritolerans]TWI96824.1 hypothetical protein JN11_03937 [Mucilaginibacter frigoritolerans]
MQHEESDILPMLGERLQSNSVISNEEQRSLLPSSKEPIRCSSLDSEHYIFSEETMEALRELGAVLQGIHNRLLAEGYVMKDGQLMKPINEPTTNTNE